MNFGRVTAPHVGEYVPQWRWVRLPLIARKSGEKRRGIEAIVGTWGGWGTRGSSTEITWGSFDRVFTYLNFKNQKLRDDSPKIRRGTGKGNGS